MSQNKNIQVIEVLNPLDPSARAYSTIEYRPGKTLEDLFPSLVMKSEFVFSVNGQIVEDKSLAYPQEGDCVVLCPVLAGSGDSGKSIFRLVAMVALAYFTGGAGGFAAGLSGSAVGTVAYSVAYAGIMMAGSMLINAMLPPPKAGKTASGASEADTPTYGVDGPKNASAEGLVVPVVYGKHRYGGNLINAYLTNDGDTQFLHMLFNCGEGPVASIDGILINDTPAANFKDLQIETRLGTADQTPISFFQNQIVPLNVGQELTDQWIYRNTDFEVDQLRFDFVCPNGLYGAYEDKAETFALPIKIEAQYRRYTADGSAQWMNMGSFASVEDHQDLVIWERIRAPGLIYLPNVPNGDGEVYVPTGGERREGNLWYGPPGTDLANTIVGRQVNRPNFTQSFDFSANKRTAVRRSFYTPDLAEARYEVRVRRDGIAGAGNPAKQIWVNQVVWTDMNQIISEVVAYKHTALLGLRVRLSDQLNGLPTVTHMNGGKLVQVWNPAIGKWEYRSSSNPAWIALDAQTNKRYGGGESVARFDMQAWMDWAAHCDVAGLEFNGVFDTAGNLWDAMSPVYRAGHAGRTNVGTRHSVTIEREQTPRMMFSVANMLQGTFKQNWMSAADRSNELEVTFLDRDDGYRQKTIRVVDEVAAAAGKPPRQTSVSFTGLTSMAEVWRDANILLNHNRLLLQTAEWSSPLEAIACAVGDVVLVQHDMPKWSLAGRLEAGSTAGKLMLDRPIAMDPGVVYSVLLHMSAIKRFSGPVSFTQGTGVFLTGFDGNAAIKRAKVNGKDVPIESVIQQGNARGIVLSSIEGITAGTIVELWDTDAIESRVVLNPATVAGQEFTEVTLALPLAAAPEQYMQWMFGRVDRVGKPFTIKSITGTHEYRRDLVAIEYNPAAFQSVPAPAAPNYSDLERFVRHAVITGVDEEVFLIGSTTRSRVTVEFEGADPGYFTSKVYMTRNGGAEEQVGEDPRQVTVEASLGDELIFRVVARDSFQRSAPRSTAPMISHVVQGRVTGPGDATGLKAEVQADAWFAEWDASTDPAVNATELRIGATWETSRLLFRGAATSCRFAFQPTGTHQLRLRHCIGSTDGLYSGNDHIKSITVLAPLQPIVEGEVDGRSIGLKWQECVTTQPLSGYKIQVGPNAQSLVDLSYSTGRNFSRVEETPGTRRYWVTAVDVAGNPGSAGYVELTTLPGIDETNAELREGLDELRDQVAQEEADRKAADAAEILARAAEVTGEREARATAIAAEQTARQNALAAEATARATAIVGEQTARAAAIQAETTNRNAAIAAEATARGNAIAGEVAARNTAISAAAAVERDERTTAIAAETTARTAAISNEATARNTAIAVEAAARTSAITAEETARNAAIAVETTNRSKAVTDEAAARAAGLTAEATARTAAIATETADRNAAIAAEATARGAALAAEVAARNTAIDAASATEVAARNAAIAVETAARTSAITVEQIARGNAIAAETTARGAAIAAEATARGDAIAAEAALRAAEDLKEANARIAAISKEQGDRATAIAAEATARGVALLAETNARTAAVNTEITARQNADTALAGQITTLNSSVGNNAAALQQEAQTRANADSAEAMSRQGLAVAILGDADVSGSLSAVSGPSLTARFTDSPAGKVWVKPTLDTLASGVLYDERTARVAADSAEVAARETLAVQIRGNATGTDVNALTSGLIYNERVARVAADSAEVTAREALSATVANNKTTTDAAILAEQTARASADAAEVTARQALAATVTGNKTATDAAILAEQNARTTADTANANAITALTTTVNSDRGTSTAGLVNEAAARAAADSAEVTQRQGLSVALTGLPDVSGDVTGVVGESLLLDFTADNYQLFAKPTGAVLTSGLLFEERTARISADEAEVIARQALAAMVNTNKGAAEAAITAEQTARANADTAIAGTVTALTTTVTNNKAAIEGALTAEQNARSNADSAEVTAREALATQMRGNATGTDVATLTSGLLFSERQARVAADSAEVTAREALAATVTSNKSSAEAAIAAERTARADGDSANAGAITALTTSFNSNKTTTDAAITAEQTARSNADTALAGQITTLSGTVTTNKTATDAALLSEQQARANADAAEVTARESLAAQVRGNATGTDIATLSSGLLFNERQARITADEAEVTARQQLAATVATNKTAAEAAITAEQTARADADSANAGAIGALTTAFNTEKASTAAAITAEQTARSNADTALAGQITTLSGTVTTNKTTADAALVAEQQARASADSAEVTARESLAAQIRGNATGTDVASLTSGLLFNERQARISADEAEVTARQGLAATVAGNKTTTDAAIAAEQTARANADTAIVGTVTALTTTVTNNKTTTDAAITAEQTARSNADTALAGQITALTATVAGNNGQASAGLLAEQSVRAAADAAEALQRQSLSTVLTGQPDPAADLSSVAGPSLSASFLTTPAGKVWVKPTGATLASGLIYEEQQARISADAAEVTARQGLATTVNNNKTAIEAALLAEQTARSTADAAEVTARTNLATTVTNNKTAVDAALLAEQTARSTADAAEVAAREALTATVATNKSAADAAILAERDARVTADEAEATARQALATTVTNNKTTTDAAIAAEASARATADAAEVTARQALAATVTGNKTAADAAMLAEQSARATADAAEVTAREALAATVLSNQGTATAAISAEAAARAAADSAEAIQRQGLSVALTGLPDLSGDVTAVVGESLLLDFTADNYQQWAKPTGAILSSGLLYEERAARISADDAEVTARQGLATTVSNNKAAIEAALLAEQQARSTADAAEVTARETLQAQMRGTYAGTDVAQVTSGLIFSERQARVTADAAEATARSNLATTVTNNKTTTDAAIAAEATARSNADAAEVTARETLQAQVRGNYTGTDVAELSSGLLFNERQARITADEAEVTARQGLAATVANNKTTTDAAILAEQTARANADAAEVTARQALAATVTGNKTTTDAAIQSEANARATADAAEANAREALAATVAGNKTTTDAAILAEQTARAGADSAEVTARENLATQIRGNATGTDINALSSGLLYNERQARVSADAAEVTAREGLAAAVATNKTTTDAAILAEQQARANADAAEVSARENLAAQMRGNATGTDIATVTSGLLYSEREARVSAVAAEATARQGLAATVANNKTAAEAAMTAEQQARSSADAAQVTARETLAAQIRGDSTGTDVNALTSGLLFNERQARVAADAAEVSARQALATTVTNNKTTTDAAITAEQTARSTGDIANANAITALTSTVTGNAGAAAAALTTEAATRASADAAEALQRQGLSVAITGVPDVAADLSTVVGPSLSARFTDTPAGNVWVKPTGATLSSGLIFEEQQARITADAAEVTARQALAATVTGNKTTTDAAIVAEQTARANADTAIAGTVTALTATVTGNKTSTDAAILAEQTARSNGDTANASAITALTTTVNSDRGTAAAGLTAEAAARAAADAAEVRQREGLSVALTGLPTASGDIASVEGESLLLDFTADSYQQWTKPTGALLSSGLIFEERQARITADEAEVTARQALAATVNTNKGLAEAAITGEQTARANAIAAEAAARQALAATVTDNKSTGDAALTAEQTARANADAAEVTARQALAATVSGNKTSTDAAILAEQNARVAADDAEATARQTLAARVDTNKGLAEAAIAAEQSARATAIGAETTARQALAATVGTNTAAISTTSTALATLAGQVKATWRLNLDVNGKITGLIVDNDGTTSNALFQVDRFAIATAGPGGTTKYPFVVGLVGGTSTVGIDGNMVVDGTIQTRMLAAESITADKIKVKSLTAAQIAAGAITTDLLNVGTGRNLLPNASFTANLDYFGTADTIGSQNFGIDSAGADWKLPNYGTATIMQTGTAFAGQSRNTRYGEIYSTEIPVLPGNRYEFSIYSGAHRCEVYAVVGYKDAAGAWISTGYVESEVNDAEKQGGKILSSFKRISCFSTAPSNAANAVVILRKGPTKVGASPATSYAMFTLGFFGEATTSQTALSPWSSSGQGVKITASGIDTPHISAISSKLGTITAGQINLQGSDGSSSFIRTNSKWWSDGSWGFVMAREPNGTVFLDYHLGACRLYMHSQGVAGWLSPGISMTDGGLTINQANVINTLNVAGGAVAYSEWTQGYMNAAMGISVPAGVVFRVLLVAHFAGALGGAAGTRGNVVDCRLTGVSPSTVLIQSYAAGDSEGGTNYGSVRAPQTMTSLIDLGPGYHTLSASMTQLGGGMNCLITMTANIVKRPQ